MPKTPRNIKFYKYNEDLSVQNQYVQKDARIEIRIPKWKKKLLQNFCETRNMGMNEFFERLMDWRLAKDGLLEYKKIEIFPDLTAEDLGMSEEQCNIKIRKINFYRNRNGG